MADILPLLLTILAAFLVIVGIMRATKKREEYCGEDPKNCLRCGEEECEKYDLVPIP